MGVADVLVDLKQVGDLSSIYSKTKKKNQDGSWTRRRSRRRAGQRGRRWMPAAGAHRCPFSPTRGSSSHRGLRMPTSHQHPPDMPRISPWHRPCLLCRPQVSVMFFRLSCTSFIFDIVRVHFEFYHVHWTYLILFESIFNNPCDAIALLCFLV